ncbi:MAG: polysaccharide deacetylase [Caulobacter sp.]|nr:polysaccharide deacetylase [Caulobacter sp.]
MIPTKLMGALTGLMLSLAVSEPAAARQPVEIALTFDDLPAHAPLPPGETRLGVAQALIAALKAAKTPPVYGFVNAVQLEKEPASAPGLDAWRAAGFPLANHTWSHVNLNQVTLAEFEADLLRNEPVLQAKMKGQDWRWLRFPYLAEGDTPEKRDAIRAFLAERRYRIASVTMSFGDFAWNEPYARCKALGDEAAIRELEDSYLKAATDSFDYYRALSATLYGRDIPYVLLMHEGAFDARMLPRLLDLYRQRGVKFVSLDQAERHPFYRADDKPAAVAAPVTLESAMAARGLPLPPQTWSLSTLAAVCR